ncbi:MAG TPA: hypothetical protein VF669_01515 [Tepidisphaeraceae bacterium]|jgi:hypothetical protein
MPANQPQVQSKPDKPHLTIFLVDNEEFETAQKELTVRQILTMSGNVPEEDYFLIEYKGQSQQEERHDNLDDVIKVHEKQRFSAGFKGTTPLS